MGRKRRERTKPEEEGEAQNGGGNPSPGPRTTRSPTQDLGAAVAAVTVEERRGRQIWGRRAAKLLGAAGGRSGGGGAAIRPCTGSHRRLPREGRGGVVVEEGWWPHRWRRGGRCDGGREEGVAAARPRSDGSAGVVSGECGRRVWDRDGRPLLEIGLGFFACI